MTWLAQVTDPEVPVLNILDLGIVRDVDLSAAPEEVTVVITPTYSGCPAMDAISLGIRIALAGRGFNKVNVTQQLSPPWTTDWMSEDGKRKLKEYGIAPPVRVSADALSLFETEQVPCPHCGAADTEMVSQFGPTSCKSLYRCLSCKEPFEYFKCH